MYNLDASRYGKGADLRALIDALHEHGICVIADVVINHRTAEKQDPSGHWNIFDGGVTDKRLAWGAWAVCTLRRFELEISLANQALIGLKSRGCHVMFKMGSHS